MVYTMTMKTILIIIGTRPEGIKLAPIIEQLKTDTAIKVVVCVTGQHNELLEPVLNFFEMEVDVNLDVMTDNQSLSQLSSRCIDQLSDVIGRIKPDLVIVQGDTTTAFMGALAAYYNQVKVAHIEAGLRSHSLYLPFPEEANRRLIGVITAYHFVPTQRAKQNLLAENIAEERIFMVGNSGIDALMMGIKKVMDNQVYYQKVMERKQIDIQQEIILVTCHRRESIGNSFKNICEALQTIASRFPNIQMVYPLHLNPNIRAVMQPLNASKNIKLIDPLAYDEMVYLMANSKLILTDSGGIQEEAPTLGKPVLVLRDVTERIEGIESGTSKLVGTDIQQIIDETSQLLTQDDIYAEMSSKINPYGSGDTAVQVQKIIKELGFDA